MKCYTFWGHSQQPANKQPQRWQKGLLWDPDPSPSWGVKGRGPGAETWSARDGRKNVGRVLLAHSLACFRRKLKVFLGTVIVQKTVWWFCTYPSVVYRITFLNAMPMQNVYLMSYGGFFIVVNGNLCIDFYEAIFKFWCIYCLHICTTMPAVLFVVMNFSLSFSFEKTENGEIAAQKVLANIIFCIWMCILISRNDVHDT